MEDIDNEKLTVKGINWSRRIASVGRSWYHIGVTNYYLKGVAMFLHISKPYII
jgi:hypothetical protein